MTAARTIWHMAGDRARRELVTTIPIRTKSEANSRDHWAAKAKRVRQQRQTVFLVVSGLLNVEGISVPCDVQLTRIAPSSGLDDDNLVSSLKAARDGVADALKVDDRDRRVTFRYAQRRGKPKQYAVEIRVMQVSQPVDNAAR